MPPGANPASELSTRLSRRLANFKLGDAVINQLADRITIEGLQIGRFDPCIYGICLDYYTDKIPALASLSKKKGVVKWEVFPYGIIEWDRFHVRVAFEVDELEGRGLNREFGR
jgi:hypothetical protein